MATNKALFKQQFRNARKCLRNPKLGFLRRKFCREYCKTMVRKANEHNGVHKPNCGILYDPVSTRDETDESADDDLVDDLPVTREWLAENIHVYDSEGDLVEE